MKFGIAVFPGTWSDRDWVSALDVAGHDSSLLWHGDSDLGGADCVVVPGGFSYGDYLRCGAVARFSPLMKSVEEFAASGGLVWGVCNGFQILCEAGLLPGALTRNASLEFRCVPTGVTVESTDSPFTSQCRAGDVLQLPISHGEGRYVADARTLDDLEASHRILFRYLVDAGHASPNGSMHDIAGIVNEGRNVLGMMPHPERACESLLGSADGLQLIQSVAASLSREGVAV